jgi:hypothetical protein
MISHPQTVDMVHKDAPVQVIERGQFESIWKSKVLKAGGFNVGNRQVHLAGAGAEGGPE